MPQCNYYIKCVKAVTKLARTSHSSQHGRWWISRPGPLGATSEYFIVTKVFYRLRYTMHRQHICRQAAHIGVVITVNNRCWLKTLGDSLPTWPIMVDLVEAFKSMQGNPVSVPGSVFRPQLPNKTYRREYSESRKNLLEWRQSSLTGQPHRSRQSSAVNTQDPTHRL